MRCQSRSPILQSAFCFTNVFIFVVLVTYVMILSKSILMFTSERDLCEVEFFWEVFIKRTKAIYGVLSFPC